MAEKSQEHETEVRSTEESLIWLRVIGVGFLSVAGRDDRDVGDVRRHLRKIPILMNRHLKKYQITYNKDVAKLVTWAFYGSLAFVGLVTILVSILVGSSAGN